MKNYIHSKDTVRQPLNTTNNICYLLRRVLKSITYNYSIRVTNLFYGLHKYKNNFTTKCIFPNYVIGNKNEYDHSFVYQMIY